MRYPILLLTLTILLSSASAALAQGPGPEKPYAPHTYSRDELITLGTYDAPPIQLKWRLVETRQIPVHDRLDFVLTFDENSSAVIDFLRKSFRERTGVGTLVPGVLPFEMDRELRVIGQGVDNLPARFTLSTAQAVHRFIIDVEARGGQTEVIVHNLMTAQLFSGVVPARAPFTPRGAAPVRFLWN